MCQYQKELVGIVSNVKYVYTYIYIQMYLYIHIFFKYRYLYHWYLYVYIYDWYLYIYWSTASPWDCLECPVVRLKTCLCKRLKKWGTSLQESQRTRITLKVPMAFQLALWGARGKTNRHIKNMKGNDSSWSVFNFAPPKIVFHSFTSIFWNGYPLVN